MHRNYHQLLPYVFKRFCILSAFLTALPTAWYYIRRPVLKKSEKTALCTMNILPPLATVWWHFAKRALGDRVDVTMFDCSGKLNQKDFIGMEIHPFLNFYAATKCQEFFCHKAKNRRIVWMCDDDMFLLSPKVVDHVEQAFNNPNIASLSFRPRGWWGFEIEGRWHEVSSSYCTAVNRKIFCEKENLSLAPIRGNPHPSVTGKKPKSYDTFDKANEILLIKGYKCCVLEKEKRDECVTGFSGFSNGVMLLNYFKKPEQMIAYLTEPPKKQWQGTVLPTVLGSLIAIRAIQKLAEKISGEKYPLPSLPSKEDLRKLREEYEPLLDGGKSWKWIDDVVGRLQELL